MVKLKIAIFALIFIVFQCQNFDILSNFKIPHPQIIQKRGFTRVCGLNFYFIEK